MTFSNTTNVIYFSPTHGSEKIAKAVASGVGMSRRKYTDLTCDFDDSEISIENELAIISVPVYAGRVAPIALQRLSRLRADNCPAILLCTYGNRDYEDALVELFDFVTQIGFKPIAAGAFVAEHSYSRPNMGIAEGRPDSSDLALAKKFGANCLKKLNEYNCFAPFEIKGNRPYRVVGPSTPMAPISNDNCHGCGTCIDACPTNAIKLADSGDKVVTDINKCIKCCACVKICPNNARIFETPYTAMLHTNCATLREPEIFM